MAQLMPLLLSVSCSSKIQIGFTFLVPANPGCPGKEAVKWLFGARDAVTQVVLRTFCRAVGCINIAKKSLLLRRMIF